MKKLVAALLIETMISLVALAAPSPAAGVETIPAAGSYVINDNRVNVRAAPDAKNGKVIGKVNKGDKVEVVEMTVLTYPVGDTTAAWFHVTDPDGWVYGAFLDPGE